MQWAAWYGYLFHVDPVDVLRDTRTIRRYAIRSAAYDLVNAELERQNRKNST